MNLVEDNQVCYLELIGYKTDVDNLKAQIKEKIENIEQCRVSTTTLYEYTLYKVPFENISILILNSFEKEAKMRFNCSVRFDSEQNLIKIKGIFPKVI